jgi:hypothetical protein
MHHSKQYKNKQNIISLGHIDCECQEQLAYTLFSINCQANGLTVIVFVKSLDWTKNNLQFECVYRQFSVVKTNATQN